VGEVKVKYVLLESYDKSKFGLVLLQLKLFTETGATDYSKKVAVWTFSMAIYTTCVKLVARRPNVARHVFLCGPRSFKF